MTEKEKNNKSGGVSRREFLKDAGLLVGGTAIGSTILLAACGDGDGATATVTKTVTSTSTVPSGTTTVTAGEVTKTVTTTTGGGTSTVTVTKTVDPGTGAAVDNTVSFTVNGQETELMVEPYWTMREVLHDKLGWTSIKDMCFGVGACGSCSVIMNGRPILSCMKLAIECDGAVIETAEGIAENTPELIDAYVKNHCMQCGYCTPGFVVTAKALLDKVPNPTEDEIRDALGGNLCRCGTYPQHIIAVQETVEAL